MAKTKTAKKKTRSKKAPVEDISVTEAMARLEAVRRAHGKKAPPAITRTERQESGQPHPVVTVSISFGNDVRSTSSGASKTPLLMLVETAEKNG